jgi:hypothetical protein
MSAVGARLQRVSPATALLIAAMAISAGVLISMQSHLTFFLDDWDLLLHRRGFSADAFLLPHNEHIVLAPVIIYKALQATVGMDSAAPNQVLSVAMFVSSIALVYVWLRRRVNEWVALLAVIPVLFLGSAWEDLLSAFQIGYFGSMTFGLAALLALERPSRRADALACAALIVAIAFSSLGVPFAVAAAVAVQSRSAGRKPWVWLVPLVLYALWWIGWGSQAESAVSFTTVAGAPAYVLAGIANGIGCLLGLAPTSGSLETGGLDWGRALLVVAAGAAFWRARATGGRSRTLWIAAALLLSFWILAAVNSGPLRPPVSARYVYVGGVMTLLVAGALLGPVRPSRLALGIGVGIVIASVAVNLIDLRNGYRSFRDLSDLERGGLTALELAHDQVDPAFRLGPDNAGADYFNLVDAGSYLSAVDKFGSPGYSEDELLAAPEKIRAVADEALAAAERIALIPGADASASGCAPVVAESGARTLELGPGTVALRAGPQGSVEVAARRFADDSYAADFGRIAAGESAILALPADRARTPWTLSFKGDGSVAVCRG